MMTRLQLTGLKFRDFCYMYLPFRLCRTLLCTWHSSFLVDSAFSVTNASIVNPDSLSLGAQGSGRRIRPLSALLPTLLSQTVDKNLQIFSRCGLYSGS